MQLVLPVGRHPTGRSGHGLVQRVVVRWRQRRSFEVLLARVVPEPVLARFVAVDDRMPGVVGVVAGVLRRRRVAAADATAVGTPTEMEPPAAGRLAVDAARPTGRRGQVDLGLVRHQPMMNGHSPQRADRPTVTPPLMSTFSSGAHAARLMSTGDISAAGRDPLSGPGRRKRTLDRHPPPALMTPDDIRWHPHPGPTEVDIRQGRYAASSRTSSIRCASVNRQGHRHGVESTTRSGKPWL